MIEDENEVDCLGIVSNDIQAVEYGIVGSNRQLPSDAHSVSYSDGGNNSDTEVITDTNTLAVEMHQRLYGRVR